ncbi:hypothetical protein [Halalkalirubrum salinum]
MSKATKITVGTIAVSAILVIAIVLSFALA